MKFSKYNTAHVIGNLILNTIVEVKSENVFFERRIEHFMLHIHRILYLLTKYEYMMGMLAGVFVDFLSHFKAVLGSADFGVMHWPHICKNGNISCIHLVGYNKAKIITSSIWCTSPCRPGTRLCH